MNKLRFLFLSAQPDGLVALHAWKAFRAIEEEILRAGAAHEFQTTGVGAAQVMDVARLLNQHRPNILHFNGHGRDAGDLLLERAGSEPMPVRRDAMAKLLRSAPEGLRLVFFCACHSDALAQASVETIDFAIGMRAAVEEQAAAHFAAAFYGALAAGRTVQASFDQALTLLEALRLGELNVPSLHTRSGADPTRTVLHRGGALVTEAPARPRAAGPLVHLRVVGTPYAYQAEPGVERLSVGRQRRKAGQSAEEGNDIVVRVEGNDAQSLRISRRHLEIARTGGHYSIIDRSGGNTVLNDARLPADQPVPLRSGDRIGIAGVLLIEFGLQGVSRSEVVHGPIDVGAGSGKSGGVIMQASVGDMVTVRDD